MGRLKSFKGLIPLSGIFTIENLNNYLNEIVELIYSNEFDGTNLNEVLRKYNIK